MIGTLLVCLRLPHSGGGVCLSRERDGIYAFDTSEHSRSSLTSIAYRPGLVEEFRPLTSGNRLVLVYDIVLTVSSLFPASTRHKWVERIQSLLLRWRFQFTQTRNLAYLLKDRYDTSELTSSKLKDGDESDVDSLCSSCSRAGLYIFLVNMKSLQVDEGYDPDLVHDWDYDTTFESWAESHRFRAILTLGGQIICRSLCVNYDQILGIDTSDESPDPETWFGQVEGYDAVS